MSMMYKNTEESGGCMNSFDPEQLICRNFSLNFHKNNFPFFYPWAFKRHVIFVEKICHCFIKYALQQALVFQYADGEMVDSRAFAVQRPWDNISRVISQISESGRQGRKVEKPR